MDAEVCRQNLILNDPHPMEKQTPVEKGSEIDPYVVGVDGGDSAECEEKTCQTKSPNDFCFDKHQRQKQERQSHGQVPRPKTAAAAPRVVTRVEGENPNRRDDS